MDGRSFFSCALKPVFALKGFNQLWIGFIFLFSVLDIMAQQQNLPFNHTFNQTEQKYFNNSKTGVHSTFKPVLESKSLAVTPPDSILKGRELNYFNENLKKKDYSDRSWISRKLFLEHLVKVDSGKFYLTVDPLMNFQLGSDRKDSTEFADTSNLYRNTRGFIVRGNIGEKVSFSTWFYENQAVYPAYVSDFVESSNVAPGQGRVKDFKRVGYDFASAGGYVSYSPAPFLNLQTGNGKFFIGDGYRSLLLSDNSFNYPYFKTSLWLLKDKIQYNIIYTAFQNVNRLNTNTATEALFERKSGNFHFLNWRVNDYLHLGLFEAGIWQTQDSSGTKPFNIASLNPLIGVNTAVYGFDDLNNHLAGLNLKVMTPFDLTFYGQLMADGTSSSEMGYQAGLSYRGISGLSLRMEYNQTKSGAYRLPQNEKQNYFHYNQPLGHTLGSGVKEFIGIINYRFGRAYARLKGISIERDYQSMETNPLDIRFIYRPNVKTLYLSAEAGFIVNPSANLVVYGGATQREVENQAYGFKETLYIYAGIKTSLRNLYFDF